MRLTGALRSSRARLFNFYNRNRAALLVRAGDFDGAKAALNKVIAHDPDNLRALEHLAHIAAGRGEWAHAMDWWTRIHDVSKETESLVAKRAAGQLKAVGLKQAAALRQAGNLNAAESVLKKVLAQNPDDVATLMQTAEVAMAREDWARAVEHWQAVVKIRGDSVARVIVKLSIGYSNQNMMDKAVAILDGARRCGLANDLLLFQLAKVLVAKGDREEAGRLACGIVSADTGLARDLNFAAFAARLFWRSGDIRRAGATLERAILGRESEEIPVHVKAIVGEIDRRLQSSEMPAGPEVSNLYYDDIYAESDKYELAGEASAYAPVWKEIACRIDGVSHVLDVGCGPGQFAEYIMRKCPALEYTGMDFSKVAIKRARARCSGAVFVEADVLTSYTVLPDKYDAIVMLEVLEHLEEDRLLLQKVPPGKKVFASVPDFDAFGHVRFFTDLFEVQERYSDLFSHLWVRSIPVNVSSSIFLMVGEKS